MRIVKNTARILVFAALLAVLLGVLSDILEHKDSTMLLEPFLENAQEYDVLFIGDSQVLNGVFPLELYHKYGIASYNMGTGNSRVPVSYWKMINALDYMTPKLIMLSVTDIDLPEFPCTEGEWLHVAFAGYPMSLNKARAILDLTDRESKDRHGVPYRDIDIVETGLRPGEKLYEELLMKGGKYAELFEVQSKYYKEGADECEEN
mgnify:CR=1 FL=1